MKSTISMDVQSFESLWQSRMFGDAQARIEPDWLAGVRIRLPDESSEPWQNAIEAARLNGRVALTGEYRHAIEDLRDALGIRLIPEAERPLSVAETTDAKPFPGCLGAARDCYWTLVYEHVAFQLANRGVRRVLEVGARFFGLTSVLVRHGFDVVVIEPNKHAHAMMSRQGIDVPLINEPFEGTVVGPEVDAVVFMESFHHMTDPVRAFAKAANEARTVLLCAEPITDDALILPYPWGPRLDGASYYAMREFGSNENGFHPSFIYGLAQSLDLESEEHSIPGIRHSSVLVLSRASAT